LFLLQLEDRANAFAPGDDGTPQVKKDDQAKQAVYPPLIVCDKSQSLLHDSLRVG
jgi:hypothetical protein